jgi:hypothetical protein
MAYTSWAGRPENRVDVARAVLKKAEDAKALGAVVSEGRRFLGLALAEEKWWQDHPLEKAPAPHVIDVRMGPTPRQVGK